MYIEFNKNLKNIPELVFTELNKYRKAGVIDLSRGLPFNAPKKEILEELLTQSLKQENNIYTDHRGLEELRVAVAKHYKDTYNIDLNPDTEIQILMGAKEGLFATMSALLNPDDRVLLPNPGFPVYEGIANFLQLDKRHYVLSEKNNFVPSKIELEAITNLKTKLLLIDYPHNPTGVNCTKADLEMFYSYAREHNLIILFDAVYRELSFTSHPTLLEVDKEKTNSIEIGSMSKIASMSGWRIAYMVGNAKIIDAVRKVKSIIDVGQFVPIQYAAKKALELTPILKQASKDYEAKANYVYNELKKAGFWVRKPEGAFFVWAKIPEGFKDSWSYVMDLLEKENVLLIPGSGYGSAGEGHFRIAVTQDANTIKAGLEKTIRHKQEYLQRSNSLNV